MKITIPAMEAAVEYLKTTGQLYRVDKPASVWLSLEVRNANPNATWEAHDAMCQEVIDKVATLI